MIIVVCVLGVFFLGVGLLVHLTKPPVHRSNSTAIGPPTGTVRIRVEWDRQRGLTTLRAEEGAKKVRTVIAQTRTRGQVDELASDYAEMYRGRGCTVELSRDTLS